jgi:tetratricopeptide (TPR) repeat protein
MYRRPAALVDEETSILKPLLRSALPLAVLLTFACHKDESTLGQSTPPPTPPVLVAQEDPLPPAAPEISPVPTQVVPTRDQAELEKALAANPQDVTAQQELSALLYGERKDLDRADDLLMSTLEVDLTAGIDGIVGRTVAYVRGGDSDRGLRLLDRALTAKPKEPRLLLLRGRYRLQRHQCERALSDFESATRFDSKNAAAHAFVGLARLCVGESEDAATAFRRSLAIDPDQPEIRKALADVAGP